MPIKTNKFEQCVVSKLVRDSMFYGYVTGMLQTTNKSINEIAEDFCMMFFEDEEPKNLTRAYYFYLDKIRK